MNSTRIVTLGVSRVCVGIALAVLTILLFGTVTPTLAQSPPAVRIIYSFGPASGKTPLNVVTDATGNLYVATRSGGSNTRCTGGCGNILGFSASGQPKVLYTFALSGEGVGGPFPNGLARDTHGNLYATTQEGGNNPANGAVFKLTPSGSGGILYSFAGGEDGQAPSGGVAVDSAGNLYGTTGLGGGTGCSPEPGCGVVYKITSSGNETVLYRFTGGADGEAPEAAPILDASGNLYGTALRGGNFNGTCAQGQGSGCGTVWKLDSSGNFSVLYTFSGGTDGALSAASLVMDGAGNLYGVASEGGDLSCSAGQGFGCGTVFEISSSGNFTVLHAFGGGASGDAQFPVGTLLRDGSGNLYGASGEGGDLSCSIGGGVGCGVVYKLDSSNNETILYAFTGGTTDGAFPTSGALTTDGKGNLFGTTAEGGIANGGVIFKVRAQ